MSSGPVKSDHIEIFMQNSGGLGKPCGWKNHWSGKNARCLTIPAGGYDDLIRARILPTGHGAMTKSGFARMIGLPHFSRFAIRHP